MPFKKTGLLIMLLLGAGVMAGCSEKKPPEKPPEAAVATDGRDAGTGPVEQGMQEAAPAPEQMAEAVGKAVEKKAPSTGAVPEAVKKELEMSVEKAPEKMAAAAAAGEKAMKEAGASVYKAKCVACHGAGGSGTAMAPAFKGNEWVKAASDDDIAGVIREGRQGASKMYREFAVPMPATKGVSGDDVNALVAYIRSVN